MGGRPNEFSTLTMRAALVRQQFVCGMCRESILMLGHPGREAHFFGEIAHAHHLHPIAQGGSADLSNCVILCQSCHSSAHQGGRYASHMRHYPSDYKYFHGPRR